jgi:TetR/AcrR family transcriptional regulator
MQADTKPINHTMDYDNKLKQILSAALKVFSRYGYRQATMEQIAGELGMTKGSLYFYCSNKEGLYNLAVAHALLKWQGRVQEAVDAEADIVQKLIALAIKSNEYLSEDDDLRTIIINDPQIQSISPAEDRYPNIGIASYGMLKKILEQGVAEKRLKAIDVEHVAGFLYSIHCMFVVKTYIKAEGQSAQDIYRAGIDVILRGLVADRVPIITPSQ